MPLRNYEGYYFSFLSIDTDFELFKYRVICDDITIGEVRALPSGYEALVCHKMGTNDDSYSSHIGEVWTRIDTLKDAAFYLMANSRDKREVDNHDWMGEDRQFYANQS